MQVFSSQWAAVYKDFINSNADYAKHARRWELGKIALVLSADNSIAVLLDLLKGQCLNAASVSYDIAKAEADFVIVGDEATWRKVLGGELAPLMGIMRGKLKLEKGSIAKLLPYAQAAIALVGSAQTIETEF